ncbi:hypothetical protein [Rhodoblastus sp.]|uniref:hypothetical protein n=1 Tax=Rhodoblastus sp. TaxID=1962975 RepID=UPI003FD7BB12
MRASSVEFFRAGRVSSAFIRLPKKRRHSPSVRGELPFFLARGASIFGGATETKPSILRFSKYALTSCV